MPNMNQFVIILSTVVTASYEFNQMRLILANFRNVITWNCDLEDEDNVLRVVSTENITTKLLTALQQAGVSSQLMEVFETENQDIDDYIHR